MPKWRAAQESLSAISWMTVGFVATRAESSAKNNSLTQISLVLAEALSLARLKSLLLERLYNRLASLDEPLIDN